MQISPAAKFSSFWKLLISSFLSSRALSIYRSIYRSFYLRFYYCKQEFRKSHQTLNFKYYFSHFKYSIRTRCFPIPFNEILTKYENTTKKKTIQVIKTSDAVGILVYPCLLVFYLLSFTLCKVRRPQEVEGYYMGKFI